MQCEKMLRRELILVNLKGDSKEKILDYMASFLIENGYAKEGYAEAILERERTNPSALPMKRRNIAIPHTDSNFIKKSAILFARLENSVLFSSMGDPENEIEVQLISMLALKERTGMGDLLNSLITAYQDSDVLERIIEARDPDDIYNILQKAISKTSESD